MSSTKHETGHFHVVVVHKKGNARAKLLFCQSKPIAFLPFSLPPPSSLLKLPNVLHPTAFRVGTIIIYPGISYNQALEFSGLPTLFKRREEISSKLFNEVVGDPGHTLHKLLPSKNPANYFLRRNRNFALPLCKTNRCKKSFIFSHVFCA